MTISRNLIYCLFGIVLSVGAACPGACRAQQIEPIQAAIEKGHYLAIAGNCMNCHTAPDGESFAGGVPIHTPFGLIYTTNITPDRATGIGGWSEADFAKAMHRGVRPGGTHLYPAFPYTAFTKISDEDLGFLFAYLKSLKPVTAPPRANEMRFPFNQRGLLSIWNLLFFKDGRFEPDASKSAQQNRGAYLVESFGHCGACHTPRNLLGGEKTSKALTGGVYLDDVASGDLRTWAAVNLTPSQSGLAAWSAEDIANYLKSGHSRRAVVFGPMIDVIMQSTRNLSDSDIGAIAAYLKSLPAHGHEDEQPDKKTLVLGEATYSLRCGTCHLPTGLGSDITAPPLVGSAVVQAPDPSTLINTIIYGPELPEPNLPLSYDKPMPDLGDDMTDEDIANVATYIRNNWGNRAAPVTEDDVAKQR